MNLEELSHFETGRQHTAANPSRLARSSPGSLKAHSLSSTPSERDWVSPFTLPPLPSLRRDDGQPNILESPEHLRDQTGTGTYFAAAWGSPYATPSPRRTLHGVGSAVPPLERSATSPSAWKHRVATRSSAGRQIPGVVSSGSQKENIERRPRKPLSEKPNWLSDSEDSRSETSVVEQDKTPTRSAFLDDWGASPAHFVKPPPSRHRISESLATITPEVFHGSRTPPLGSEQQPTRPMASGETTMAVQEVGNTQTADKPLPEIRRRSSLIEVGDNPPESPVAATRPRPASMQSYQRPKKKVYCNGKACIIALPLTDREAAGLPPVLTPQEVKQRIDRWIQAGYSVDGFELSHQPPGEPRDGSGQSRPVYPDPADLTTERKLRSFHVHIPNQAEWESWVNYLKEEKLRALGVSPSNSEAPPSTRSPFSPTLSRVSSGFAGLAPSPPVAPSSSASNPLRATTNPFSPSLMSSAGISPQPASVTSSQFSGPSKPSHGFKPSIAQPHAHGRITSPFDHTLSQSISFGPGMRPGVQSLSSRQNSFSPPHQVQLPNLGEVLSPISHQRGMDGKDVGAGYPADQNRHDPLHSQGHVLSPPNPSQDTPGSALPPRMDSLVRTPEYSESPRTPIEIAHPTPKSHRHNLSMALQREIDEAEAALREKQTDDQIDQSENFDIASRKDSAFDEEPPILRRPETISAVDERSEIETNPSIAATPMLIDDKNPFVNWQALSDAAKAEPQAARELAHSTSKFNVEAREFDPQAGFSSSNFSFGSGGFAPFGLPKSASAPSVENPSTKRDLSGSHLNAGAPAFTPSFVSEATPNDSAFKFTASTFNVAAPVFNPSRSSGTNLKDSVSEGHSTTTNSIFGSVVIDPRSKVTRRSSKAVPIRVPKANYAQEHVEHSTDDEGRPMAPAERQKRARRHGSDGDRTPVFAEPAQSGHRRILSEIVDDADANGPPPEAFKQPFEGWAYIPAESTEFDDIADIPPERVEPELGSETETSFTFKNQNEAAMFNDARPPLEMGEEAESEEAAEAEVNVQESLTPAKAKELDDTGSQKPKSSLSALAKPFEFKPQTSSPSASSSFATPRKVQGLEASKYATPSPLVSSTGVMANLSSPPAHMPQYVRKDDESGSNASDTVEVFEAKSDEDDIVEVIEENTEDDDTISPRATERSSRESKDLTVQPGSEDQFDVSPLSESHQDQPVPSFEEIDAVMKQFEVDPELGIERNDTPLKSTPLVDMRLTSNFRSDAPSPSPPGFHDEQLPHSNASFPRSFGLGIGVHHLNPGREDTSDWGDALPAAEEAKLQLRSQFFDAHVDGLVGGILENRLGPIEHTLQTIQHTLALMGSQPKSKNDRRSLSTDVKDSDADDEDDYDAFEGFSSYRTKSPLARRGERKQDLIRNAVAEALAAYNPPSQPQPSIDMTEFNAIVQEMRRLARETGSQRTQDELKTIMEDVISHHPRLRGSRVQQDHEATEIKYRPQIDGLETMLKISQEHAAEEAQLRRKAEAEINEMRLRLRIAEEEAAQYRESSDEAQHTLEAFVEEKESYRNLAREVDALTLKNTALETTLEEYRVSSDKWREDIRSERANNQELKHTLQEVHYQLTEQTISRQNLRTKLDRVQSQMTHLVEDLHAEQADWREKEHSLLSKLALVQDTLEQERRHREKAEMELDTLDKEHKANLQFKHAVEHAQSEISKLNSLVESLREENRALETRVFSLDRELAHTIQSKDAELATSTVKLQAELESAQTQLQSIRTDSEAHISRLQNRLDHAELDIEDQKAKHDALLTETIEAHKEALREANERRESSLEEQHQAHEKKLNDLRDRHTRELHNSFDNRTRLEHQLNERLNLSNDKVKHLETKVADLEERLEITKSAARATVEAATAKGVNLPTPASSVVASPPQRAASASMSFVKGSEVPEKISPQALRESIMVLQDQLQNREQKIEQLESELAAVDKEAPIKLKERETEISWLRELLGVRIDDIEDIIATLSKPDFDRDSVKDAAIRLKANLQMEQQLRERAAAGLSSSFPSLSSITTYAQSPRALPMAAAAAWGNWRKARDNSIGALSDLATNLGSQTPSKSTMGSPASFLSGIMTPPSTTQKTSEPGDRSIAPPSMRPLAAAAQARKAGPEARPLRAYSSKPRALSSRQPEKRTESSPQTQSSPLQPTAEPPRTPIQTSNRSSLDLGEDVDDDASPFDGENPRHLEEVEPVAE